MKSCKNRIEEYFKDKSCGEIVVASDMYIEKFSDCTEAAFFKTMERLVQSGFLTRVSKGIYSKAPMENTGSLNQSDAVLNHYFGANNDNGMFVGYKLYAKYGISEYDNGQIELYSNILNQVQKRIGNISIKRVDIDLNYDNTRIIEALEIMQNYPHIEDCNKMKAARYFKQIALGYKDASANEVLAKVKYKKGTIAFFKYILDGYNITNTLSKHLSCASQYDIPKIRFFSTN